MNDIDKINCKLSDSETVHRLASALEELYTIVDDTSRGSFSSESRWEDAMRRASAVLSDYYYEAESHD